MPLASRVLVVGLISALAGCAGLPAGVDRLPSSAYVDTGDTRTRPRLRGAVAAIPARPASALPNGRDAFAARMLLARAAERSLDVQYYIWHDDTTGNLLCEALWQAAERGVRVRLLLDDHEHARARRTRSPRSTRIPTSRCGCSTRSRTGLSHRRLLDSFGAPEPAHAQQVVHRGQPGGDRRRPQHRRRILRGRHRVAFADLDVIAAGAVVRTCRRSSTPTGTARRPTRRRLIGARADGRGADARGMAEAERQSAGGRVCRCGARHAAGAAAARRQAAAGVVGRALVSDDPAKVLRSARAHAICRCCRASGRWASRSASWTWSRPISCRREEGIDATACASPRAACKVRVLTNSLAATDVAPVHAGYAKYREALLRGGVRLFELKPARRRRHERDQRSAGGSSDAEPAREDLRGRPQPRSSSARSISTRARRGSTPRWASSWKARRSRRSCRTPSTSISARAYEVRLAADGKGVEWIEQTAAGEVRHSSTPGANATRMLFVNPLRIPPIEWLL